MFFVLTRSIIFTIQIAFFFLRIFFLSTCFKPLLIFLIAALLFVYISTCFSFGIVKIAAHIATSSAIVDDGQPSKLNANSSSGHSCVSFIWTHPIPMFLTSVLSLVLVFAAPSVYIMNLSLLLVTFLLRVLIISWQTFFSNFCHLTISISNSSIISGSFSLCSSFFSFSVSTFSVICPIYVLILLLYFLINVLGITLIFLFILIHC